VSSRRLQSSLPLIVHQAVDGWVRFPGITRKCTNYRIGRQSNVASVRYANFCDDVA